MKYLVLFEKGNLKDFDLVPEETGLIINCSKEILSAVDYMERVFDEEFLTIYRYNEVIKYIKKENPNFKVYTEEQLMKCQKELEWKYLELKEYQ